MRQPDAALHADRRARILAAAEQQFAEHGFHKATMQMIAAAAEMSPGNLYRYFPSKDAIIQAFAEGEREESAKTFAEVAAAADIVDGLLSATLRYVLEEPRESIAVTLEVLAEMTRNPAVAAPIEAVERAVHADFREVLTHARTAGRLRPDLDPDAAAMLLLALADGLLTRRLLRAGLDAERVTAALRELLERYLRAPSL